MSEFVKLSSIIINIDYVLNIMVQDRTLTIYWIDEMDSTSILFENKEKALLFLNDLYLKIK